MLHNGQAEEAERYNLCEIVRESDKTIVVKIRANKGGRMKNKQNDFAPAEYG